MPQPRSSGSRSQSGAKASTRSTRAKRSTAGSAGSSATPPAGESGAGQSRASSRRAARSTSAGASGSADARLEAGAQRARKLNERIIEASKEAGESTLSSYEKALKAMATSIERGPGSSDVEWISQVATAQAKFIREVTTAWTSAARDVLK